MDYFSSICNGKGGWEGEERKEKRKKKKTNEIVYKHSQNNSAAPSNARKEYIDIATEIETETN